VSRRAQRVPDVLAAVDLGSNSFHLVVAQYRNGQLVVIDRLREPVQLASGLDDEGRLDKEVIARALACLKRFGQRISEMHADAVRVAGTSAMRRARRKQAFLERARDALGHPVEIISGREEARLIYAGVSQSLPAESGNRLVVDIGGGSTELIVGRGFEPLELESVNLGCVGLSQKIFADGKLSAKRFERALLMAKQHIEPVQEIFLKRGWEAAAGSSGSVRTVFEACRELDPKTVAITPEGIATVIEVLCRGGHIEAIPFTTVTEDRRNVFSGGVAILSAVFSQLKLRQMRWSEGAMREGLLYDMIGRFTHEDARERTVRSMQQRYHVDLAQAARVEQTALKLLAQVQESWRLPDPSAEQTLTWACRLHEIGLDVAHSGYHRHGAYLLQNADMPGFAREEQALLARLVGAHRKKLMLEGLEELSPPWDERAIYLILILRLAVLLHRDRSESSVAEVTLTGRPRTLELRFRIRSFRDHPLTAADLNDEIDYLRAQGLRLRVFTAGAQPA
jgi:exopolyphosphatase/guanosine-5'-triphosphate,3'-diphosphate pyrophosphatase